MYTIKVGVACIGDVCTYNNLQSVLEPIIQLHYSCLIATAVTVVWCTENSYHIAFMAPVVALYHICREIHEIVS